MSGAGGSSESVAACTRSFRLPFGRKPWRTAQGNWLGVGLGSSIDFQDHRAYAPGDDPRYIHWAAYARTGQLTMKLYRAEVSPGIDLLIDTSTSMSFLPEKARRTDELLAFFSHSARLAGASIRAHAFCGEALELLRPDRLGLPGWRDHLKLAAPVSRASATPPASFPWRSSALKVLVSDLLFPGEPHQALGPLSLGTGLALIFAPALPSESELLPRGGVDLVDCESGRTRRQWIDDGLANRYRLAYRRHFELWQEAARIRGVLCAAVPCELPLPEALAQEALRHGLIEYQS